MNEKIVLPGPEELAQRIRRLRAELDAAMKLYKVSLRAFELAEQIRQEEKSQQGRTE